MVSACLSGQPVRYDGNHKFLGAVYGKLEQWLELVIYCPEVAAGMATPRPPIRLVEQGAQVQAQEVEHPQTHVEAQLQHSALSWCKMSNDINAAVLKARSPSCGFNTTPIFSSDLHQSRLGSGIFATALQHELGVAIVDETYFCRENRLVWFVLGCYLEANTMTGENALVKDLGWEGNLQKFLATPAALQGKRLQLIC